MTEILISDTEIKSALGRIFSDSVILNKEHRIVSVGTSICAKLGYSEKRFCGQPLSILTGNSFAEKLQDLLINGFFEDNQVEVFNTEGISFPCNITGFYLGSISDLNDLIVLKFSSSYDGESTQKRPTDKNDAMDEFVYSTSHGLRGPLATIKGLINLLKIHKQVDDEHQFIISQMNHFAEKLDDRLHKLIYFAESDNTYECSKARMSLADVAEKLCDDEFDAKLFPKIDYSATISESSTVLDNAGLILALLQNLKAFLRRRSSGDFNLIFNAASYENFTELELIGSEIVLGKECQRKIERVNIGFTEILNDPEFTDLYSAKKIALKLQARMRLQLFGKCMRAHIIIPKDVGALDERSLSAVNHFEN